MDHRTHLLLEFRGGGPSKGVPDKLKRELRSSLVDPQIQKKDLGDGRARQHLYHAGKDQENA